MLGYITRVNKLHKMCHYVFFYNSFSAFIFNKLLLVLISLMYLISTFLLLITAYFVCIFMRRGCRQPVLLSLFLFYCFTFRFLLTREQINEKQPPSTPLLPCPYKKPFKDSLIDPKCY